MDLRSITRRARTLIPLVALAIGGNCLAVMDSTGDYRDFRFSAGQPYFVQNGKVDFGTYNGFRRYHSECHVCHGPAGVGSSYAPSLLAAVKILDFHEFVDVIVRGRMGQENFVMPGFAENMNVLPFLHDIYAYLKARSDGVVSVNRPSKFPKLQMARVSAMAGMSGMSGMGGMGMFGMSGMGGMAGMGTMLGMSGAYTTGPDGSVYLFPTKTHGPSGKSTMSGQYRVDSSGRIQLQPIGTGGMSGMSGRIR